MTISFDRVDLYTQAMNAAFVQGYDAVPEQPPIAQALTEVPSEGKIENYPWLYPPPLMREWQGYRNFAKLGETNYRVPNLVYTAEFEVGEDELNDDQINGFKRQAANLAQGAQAYPYIKVLQTLALGQTTPCFDGTNFFASSHTVGTGNNVFTATTAGSDAVTHAMVVLVTRNSMVKPLLWQRRTAPKLLTDMGTQEAQKVRMVKWWADMRGAAAFGFWWDAVLGKFGNTPTVAEVQTALGTANARLRGFKYPKNQAGDADLYPHGQTVFDKDSVLVVCSTGIEHIVRQALTLSLISQTENYFKGWASLAASGYLDGVT